MSAIQSNESNLFLIVCIYLLYVIMIYDQKPLNFNLKF